MDDAALSHTAVVAVILSAFYIFPPVFCRWHLPFQQFIPASKRETLCQESFHCYKFNLKDGFS